MKSRSSSTRRSGSPSDELVDGPGPEDPADHRRGLQRLLLGRLEQVDPRCDHRLHGVRHREVRRQRRQASRTVRRVPADPRSMQGAEHLLDEERVALRALDDDVTQARTGAFPEQLVEHLGGVVRCESASSASVAPGCARPTPVAARAARAARSRSAAGVLGASRTSRSRRSSSRLLGPVDVLDEHDEGPLRGDLLEEVDPGVLEAIARGEWVQVLRHIEPEREPEDLRESRAPRARPMADRSPAIREMLPEHLRQRPIGDALAVGRGTGRFAAAVPASGRRAAPRTRARAGSCPRRRRRGS